MLPIKAHNYLFASLEGTPQVIETLLNDLTPDSPKWDERPDPDRFTLREILAHLADWEEIFLARMHRTHTENEPMLPDMDEGRLAIENDYSRSEPLHSQGRFKAMRAELVSFLRSLKPDDWQRIGNRELLGRMTLEEQAVLINLHDGNHLLQIVQWLKQ